jgi:hypothetical protein
VSLDTSRWDRIISRITNIVVLIAGLITIAVGVSYLASLARPSAPTAASSRGGLVPGQPVLLNGVDWAAKDRPIVLALSPLCRFCVESNEFYRRLAAKAQRNARLGVVALFGTTESAGQDYVRQHGIAATQVISAPVEGISATPTLLLVDRRGQVDKVWVGKLSPADEEAVMSMLE